MVEVVPRKTEIRIRLRGCFFLLALVAVFALIALWALLGTQFGARNPWSESLRRFAPLRVFSPKAKPADNLGAALRIHGFEALGGGRHAVLFSVTDDNRDPVNVVPLSAVALAAVPAGGGASQPVKVDQVMPLHLMNTWKDRVGMAAIMDYSGSMYVSDLAIVENTYEEFFKALVIPDTAGTVLKFDDNVLTTARLTESRDEIIKGVKQHFPGGGTTALFKAIDDGITAIQARPHFRFLLLTTDGNNNNPPDLDPVLNRARQHQVSAFVLGFGYLDVSELQRIADETDGYYIYLPTSSDVKTWFPRLGAIVNNVQVLTFTTGISKIERLDLTVTTTKNTLTRSRRF